jgi:hypothetical protein
MADVAPFPYLAIPHEARWRDVMADRTPQEIDPHLDTRLRISPSDRIASAGSCFAQRIVESLRSTGYNYLVTEEGSPFLSAEDKKTLGYGLYSARYGNVYSALQLLQLFRRAFGSYEPAEPLWRLAKGGYVDPFRPSVQPDGFKTEEECLGDREAHLAAVRRMFREVDIFAFTLGLTETWCSKIDGAAFPSCPGSSLGGTYDPSRHLFHNFSVSEVTDHLNAFVAELQAVNPKAQIILTISPVPLLATFEPRHVLQATVYSKSVLRVASEEILRRHPHVHYFASYEIVLASGDSKNYFLDDHRTVSDAAVAHVMECFHRQYTGVQAAASTEKVKQNDAAPADNKPMCDEDLVMAALADQVMAGQNINER